MSGQFWLGGEQVARLKRYFPKARGRPRVDDRRMLSGIRLWFGPSRAPFKLRTGTLSEAHIGLTQHGI